jgi:serine/threonine protein kinase
MDERSSLPIQVGEIVAGKYRVEEVLGRGGMGVVVAGRHIALDKLYAIKLMNAAAYRSAEAAERFHREALNAARLRSEHVVQVFDIGKLEDGAPFIVMEHLQGLDLHALLQREGALPIQRAVLYVAQACEAVAEAHAAGIIHRDLKPANLFLTQRPNGTPCVKVLDFGLSKQTTPGLDDEETALTRSNAGMGTPYYMSPEQMRSARDVDARADVWALGVILYELVTGKRPFPGSSFFDVAVLVNTARPSAPSTYRPDVPPKLEEIILRCLARDPGQRIQDAADLLRALTPFAGAPLSPAPSATMAQARPSDRPPLNGDAPTELPRVTVRTDRTRLPIEPSDRLLRVTLRVPEAEGIEARKPVHLSLVIDRSGSMDGEKLHLALQAARQAIRSLQPGDRFSVVTFDNNVEVPVPSTDVTPEARLRAEAALARVTSGGNTDLAGGWLRGCALVGAHLPEDAVGRCLLLTDGQANHGITSPDELTRLAREHRLRGVTTSTIGLGAGFNELLLGRLSEEGGGNFYFAERAAQLPGFVAEELGEVLAVVARDASLRIQVPAGIEVESLNDYPCNPGGSTFSFSLGSLPGGLELAPMFRLRFPAGPLGQKLSATVELTDRDGALSKEPWTLAWTRVTQEPLRAEVVDLEVLRPAAALDAARARRIALELNQNGRWQESASRLAEAANRLRGYAEGDPEILAEADRLDAEKADYARQMSSLGAKERHFRAMRAMKMVRPGEPEGHVLGLPTTPRLVPLLQTAIEALSGVKGAPTLEMDLSLQGVSLPPGRLSRDDENNLTTEGILLNPSALKIIFVEQQLDDNWFSHWHARTRTAVVSLADLGPLTSLLAASFVAYELVLHGLRALWPEYKPEQLIHPETRACLFDLCQIKNDVGIKLQAGHICDTCRQNLSALGLGRDDLVTQLWRAVQGLAQSKKMPF